MKRNSLVLILMALLLTPPLACAVSIDWVKIPYFTPGEFQDGIPYGASTPYSIARYDVTNSQYVEFLNLKDPTGANALGLYTSLMANVTYGGINLNSLAADGSKYSVISGRDNHPVNYVDSDSALRFANWMNNGQGTATTETGAYTMSNLGLFHVHSANANIFLPNQNQWFAAAYFDPVTNQFNMYPLGSNTAPTGSAPTSLANHANLGTGNLTDVGAYTGSPSPMGVYDMAGNVGTWLEDNDIHGNVYWGGTSFLDGAESSSKLVHHFSEGDLTVRTLGIRLAAIYNIPEPSTGLLAILGAACMWRFRKLTKLHRNRADRAAT